jgi:hypothetical protein
MEKHGKDQCNRKTHLLYQERFENNMSEKSTTFNITVTLAVCVTLIVFALIGGRGYYSVVDRELMSQNIQRAIERGIDPLSVRCSYADSDDLVCVAYAASTGTKLPK